MPSRLHEALITHHQDQRRWTPKPQQPAKPKRKRGRPRKGEERPKEPSRLAPAGDRPEMLAEERCVQRIGILDRLPAAYRRRRRSCILTSASVNDSQVASQAERVTNLYDLGRGLRCYAEIRAHSESLGHVRLAQQQSSEAGGESEAHSRPTVPGSGRRWSGPEGRVCVRGHSKVLCHLSSRVACAGELPDLRSTYHRSRADHIRADRPCRIVGRSGALTRRRSRGVRKRPRSRNRQGGVPDRHYQACKRGATPSVRLGEYPRAAQRSDLLAGLCRVR